MHRCCIYAGEKDARYPSLRAAGTLGRACVRVSVQIFATGGRHSEESARPLSLLIKPNRNRKAESKLHNYTGLPLSLAPTTHRTYSSPLPSLFLSVFLLSPLFPFFFPLSSLLFLSGNLPSSVPPSASSKARCRNRPKINQDERSSRSKR